MKPTSIITGDCTDWTGPEKEYQAAAADVLDSVGRPQPNWTWITPRCGNEKCVNPDHLVGRTPLRLEYPHHLCIYCGRRAYTKDHLLPRNWSGEGVRHFVVIVPACGTCNSVLSDTLTWSITERRAICHARLRRRFAKVLRIPDRDDAELAEFGSTMREFIEEGMAKKAEVERMLPWPIDPAYDLRALAKSGIENGYATGLLIEEDDTLRALVKAVA